MKRTFLLILASLLVTLGSSFADDATNITLDWKNVDVSQALSIYQKMSGLELVIDSPARVGTPITIQTSVSMSKAETMKLVEKSLVTQAGIVITRLDDKRASVTFNDALTINPVRK
jgi:type II secretory pathway component GspD/PulD (secretin)